MDGDGVVAEEVGDNEPPVHVDGLVCVQASYEPQHVAVEAVPVDEGGGGLMSPDRDP